LQRGHRRLPHHPRRNQTRGDTLDGPILSRRQDDSRVYHPPDHLAVRGRTEAKYDPDSNTAQCTAFTTHSGNPTLGDDLGYRASLADAIGAGVIWTFGDTGIRVPVGTANGVGVIVENGTGQACQAYIVWDE
jgi:hypothetical protein